jgi:hypothetical protein
MKIGRDRGPGEDEGRSRRCDGAPSVECNGSDKGSAEQAVQ